MNQPRLPEGHRLARFESIDSTNSEALRRAAAGDGGPLWIWAERQVAGRGRAGRIWSSEQGNLFTSLLLTPGCPLEQASQLALVAGVALWDFVAVEIGEERAADLILKWPNDLLICDCPLPQPSPSPLEGEGWGGGSSGTEPAAPPITPLPASAKRGTAPSLRNPPPRGGRECCGEGVGAKLAGILLESTRNATAHRASVVIGMGLNLASHSRDLGRPATDLSQLGVSLTPGAALEGIAAGMADWLGRWDEGRGFAAVRDAWLERAGPLGRPIRVRVNGHDAEGAFAGIGADGALKLHTAEGEQTVSAGDVFLL